MFDPLHIAQHDALYPPVLRTYLNNRAPATITARGNLDILLGRGTARRAPTLALFCSIQCSSAIILQTYEACACLLTGKPPSRKSVCCSSRPLPRSNAGLRRVVRRHETRLLPHLPMSCSLPMLPLAAKPSDSAILCELGVSRCGR